MFKNEVEKLVERKQKLLLQKEKLEDRHNFKDASFDNKIDKLKNKKYQEKQVYETKLKNLERAINKTKKQITVEKAFVSEIDRD